MRAVYRCRASRASCQQDRVGSRSRGVYLVSGGPLVGNEVRVALTDGLTEFKVVDPASGETILALAR